MVISQADMFVPGWNELMLAMARTSVSCTRSCARSTLPLSEIANARRLGTAASMHHARMAEADQRTTFGHASRTASNQQVTVPAGALVAAPVGARFHPTLHISDLDLHRLLIAGLPAHCERFWTLPCRLRSLTW